jgi:hypothetical protein
MRPENIWDVDAAQRYDTPGDGMFAPEVIGPTIDRPSEGCPSPGSSSPDR